MVEQIRNETVRSTQHAAFVTACAHHCGQWGQHQRPTKESRASADWLVRIDGYTAATALDEWWGAVASGRRPPRREWIQRAAFPCHPCCAGMEPAFPLPRSRI